MYTDAGITGLGETLTYDHSGEEAKFVAQGVRSLERHVTGENPLGVKQRWSDLYQHVKRSGAFKPSSAIDEALWDIVEKNADRPLYELLGGATNEVAAYATFPHRKPACELVPDGTWLSDAGFDSMKITVGAGVETDRGRTRTVGESLPPGFGFAMDANTSFRFSEALPLARTVEELGMEWFEESISHTNIDGQAELSHRVNVPIVAYQSPIPTIQPSITFERLHLK